MIGTGSDAFVWVEEGRLISMQLQGIDLDRQAALLDLASNQQLSNYTVTAARGYFTLFTITASFYIRSPS